MTLRELVDKAHKNSVEKGWWENGSTNIPEKLMMIVSEVSEALEEYREHTEPLNKVRYAEKDKPVGFASELADVVIRCFDLAGYLKIDLEQVVKDKMEYNMTRSYRHGNKKC